MKELIIYLIKLIMLVIVQSGGIFLGAMIAINYVKRNFSFNQKINIFLNDENEKQLITTKQHQQ